MRALERLSRFPALVALFTVAICFCGTELFAAGQLRTATNDAGLFDPAQGPLVIHYQLLEDASRVEVRILDFRAQVANRFTFVELRAGDHSFSWDGTDNNGERVVEGRYQIAIEAELVSGIIDGLVVNTVVAELQDQQTMQLPEPLKPETFPYSVFGSVSTFYRYNNEREEKDEGEVRLRTGVDYRDERYTTRGVFQVIQDYEGSPASFNGSQAMAEGRWQSGKLKGVFRDNIGSFEDPMQLFSDFRTERNKLGAAFDQTLEKARMRGIIFASEGDVDSEERGGALRLSYGDQSLYHIGTSLTFRKGIDEPFGVELQETTTVAADLLWGMMDFFSVTAQAVATENDVRGSDYGGVIRGEYDNGRFRATAGYISLGESFSAPFSDPLRQVYSDARGFDVSIDYFMQQPLYRLSSLTATLRFFDLVRPSDDSIIREVDGSLRFSVGNRDSFFLSIFHREDEFGTNNNFMANMSHKWSDVWSNLLQVNYSETDTTDSLRLTCNTNYTAPAYTSRLSLEWTRRTIDYSRLSPYDQGYVRFDLENNRYHLQLQGKYSGNTEDSGFNLFARLDYTPEFLHRYKMLVYCSLGNRSALETEEQIEVGLEVQF